MKIPHMLHHAAYVTHDAAATVGFYRDVLGLELVAAVIDDEIPSTGDPYPYLHIFFELGDGSSLAFFEAVELPPAAAATHPAHNIFNHLALDVGSRAEVDRWASVLREKDVEIVGPVDHGIIYSIYFYDPNGIRLELTANTDSAWKKQGDKARQALGEWCAAREDSRRLGDNAPMHELIARRRREHKRNGDAPPRPID